MRFHIYRHAYMQIYMHAERLIYCTISCIYISRITNISFRSLSVIYWYVSTYTYPLHIQSGSCHTIKSSKEMTASDWTSYVMYVIRFWDHHINNNIFDLVLLKATCTVLRYWCMGNGNKLKCGMKLWPDISKFHCHISTMRTFKVPFFRFFFFCCIFPDQRKEEWTKLTTYVRPCPELNVQPNKLHTSNYEFESHRGDGVCRFVISFLFPGRPPKLSSSEPWPCLCLSPLVFSSSSE